MADEQVGQGQFSGQSSASVARGTSLVVRLFVAIVRNEVEVHAPANDFETVAVWPVGRYCLQCFTAGLWDVWHGRHEGLDFQVGRCRACGCEKSLSEES